MFPGITLFYIVQSFKDVDPHNSMYHFKPFLIPMKNLIYLFLFSLTIPSCKKEEARQVNQYTIEQFYANTRFGGGTFSADETKLLINSDESGIYNLYEINL